MNTEVSIENQAKQLGWVPKEQFRGPEEAWVDAETFVRKGEEILPIVNANNKKLHSELARTTAQVAELKKLVEAGADSLKAFEEFHRDSLSRALEQQRAELVKQLTEARNEGDVSREIEVQDQLDEVRQQQKDVKKIVKAEPSAAVQQQSSNAPDPEFTAWHAENPWFGTDVKKTAYANGLAQTMRMDPANANLTGRQFYDKVKEGVAELFGDIDDTPRHSKVEGAANSSARNSGRGRSFADLPAEAKVACDRFGTRLVGEGRAYKTLDDWRKQYAKDFFAGEQQ